MSIINSFFHSSHQESVISELKESQNLPFSEVLSMEEIREHLQILGGRERIFTPEVSLYAFLSQVMDDDQSQQGAVARVIAAKLAENQTPPSANTSAYSQARSKLPEAGLEKLASTVATKLANNTPDSWLWKGKLQIKIVDGTTLSMPDTPENQQEYPQSKSQQVGVGFPIMRAVALIDYAGGAVLDLAMGAYQGKKTGEHALFRELMDSLQTHDVLLGDCYYPSYFLMATLLESGISGVFPAHASRKQDFRCGQRLGQKDHIVSWIRPSKPTWMTAAEYNAFPKEIKVREVEIQMKRNGCRAKARVLVTTFLDHKDVTKADLIELYGCRWFVEISLNSIKSTMHMDILRGKTPSMVHKEIWVHLLAYNLIRKIMAQAALAHDRLPCTLSFKLALQSIRIFMQAGLLAQDNPQLFKQLLKMIVHKQIANRPGRKEPRCRKRRPKAFPLLKKARGLYKNAA